MHSALGLPSQNLVPEKEDGDGEADKPRKNMLGVQRGGVRDREQVGEVLQVGRGGEVWEGHLPQDLTGTSTQPVEG